MKKTFNSSVFFKNSFGFYETNYDNTRTNLLSIYNNNKLNGIDCGNFYVESLINKKHQMISGGSVTFKNIIGDSRNIHLSSKNINATHQVASQLNCLEMVSPNKTPEDGIEIYEYDRTQGPICAMLAPAGIAYRNYLYNGGQTLSNQINIIGEFHDFLMRQTKSTTPLWTTQNGYMMFNSKEELLKINTILSLSSEIRKEAMSKICVGIHENVGIVNSNVNGVQLHNANQVYCSGLPISYNNLPTDMWDGLSELVLDAMYENTLMSAVKNNIRNNCDATCYLTMIGGGVFGMKHSQIMRAICRACNVVAMNGHILDVKLVHYLSFNDEYFKLKDEYPLNQNDSLNIINDLSIWNNFEWINTYTNIF
jgi:hypothetical protein